MNRVVFPLSTILILSVLSIFAGCTRDEPPVIGSEQDTRQVPVRILPMEPREFVEYGEYYGTVTPVEEVILTARAGGRVQAIYAQPGDTVAAGDSLGRIDAETVATHHETAALQERIARREYETRRRLFQSGSASEVSVDQAHLAWLQSKSALIEARKNLDGARSVTPIAGTVVARYIEPHQELPAGASTFAIADLSKMKVIVGVPEGDLVGSDSLQSAEVRLASVSGRVWEGTPVSVARKRSDRTLSFAVEIVVDNADGALMSGSTATVRLGLRQMDDQLVVPTSAILTEGDQSYVMIANSPTARKIPVEIGSTSDTETVIASGLSVGDEVIVQGINQVRDGDQVRPVGKSPLE